MTKVFMLHLLSLTQVVTCKKSVDGLTNVIERFILKDNSVKIESQGGTIWRFLLPLE